jgi:dienelactone hydrolase
MQLNTPANSSPPDRQSLASRIEVHPIPSLTLSDTQFLRGEKTAGVPVTVGGVLHVAQGSGRLPLVVLVHGSGGINSGIDAWERLFLSAGIATLTLDGFTGRGLRSVNADQSQLGRLAMIVDTYRALAIMAAHPLIDPARIVLMGFSRGGQTALYTALRRFHTLWNDSGATFAGYLPFYPDCSTRYLQDTEIVDCPIRIHHGTADDYDTFAHCADHVTRLQAAGANVRLTPYEGAQHAFDVPLLPTLPVALKEAQTVRNCAICEDEHGRLINMATGQPFSYDDDDVEIGPHVAYSPHALQVARAAVMRDLDEIFNLT